MSQLSLSLLEALIMSASSFYTALSTFGPSAVETSLGDIDDAFIGHTSERYNKNLQ